MTVDQIKTSSIILLAKTEKENCYIFGAYKDNGEATSFLNLPEDHKMFVDTLTNQQTIMGYKTLKATPTDFPDAGRICITHHPNKIDNNAIPASSISEAIDIAKKRAQKTEKDTVFVIGGASIIKQCLEQDLLDEVRLTLTQDYNKPVSNPVYLEFNIDDWNIKKDSGILTSKNAKPNNLKYQYLTLAKRK